MRSISENSLAAATARINIAVCLISCLGNKDISIYQKIRTCSYITFCMLFLETKLLNS